MESNGFFRLNFTLFEFRNINEQEAHHQQQMPTNQTANASRIGDREVHEYEDDTATTIQMPYHENFQRTRRFETIEHYERGGEEEEEEKGGDDEYYDDTEYDIDRIYHMDDEIDLVYFTDYLFMNANREDKKYYIGLCYDIYENDEQKFLLGCCISPTVFFQFPFQTILQYLIQFTISDITNSTIKDRVNIIQVVKEEERYTTVIKTHWLGLVQRYWKRVFKEKKKIQEKRKSLHAQRYFELHGKYPLGLNVIPSYFGRFRVFDKYTSYPAPSHILSS